MDNLTPAERARLAHPVPRIAQAIAEQTVRKRNVPHQYLDDLVSAGMEAGLKAARDYDPVHRVPFEAYAKIRIRGAVVDEMRKLMGARGTGQTDEHGNPLYRQTRHQTVSRDAMPGLEHRDPHDPQGSVDDAAQSASENAQLMAAMSRLSERDHWLIEQRYIKNRQVQEIAKDLNLTTSGATHAIGAAMGRLRDELWRMQELDPGEAVRRVSPPTRQPRGVRASPDLPSTVARGLRSAPGVTGIPQQRQPRG